MALTVLYAGSEAERDDWRSALAQGADARGMELTLVFDPETVAAETVDVLLFAPDGPVPDLRRFPRLAAIQSLWAGVETIVTRPDLPPGVPIARMVDPGMTEAMVEYVLGAVMRVHLGHDRLLDQRRDRVWRPIAPPLARDRTVGVMGLGVLGAACAQALARLGFDVAGWSRRPRILDGVESHAGIAALPGFLARSEILVILTPLTEQTRGLMDAEMLAKLPAGAHVINVARGPILDDAALLDALARPDGLGGATLDVFDVEPLPDDHRFWDEPRIMITPHIASVSRPETAAPVVLDQLDRLQRGEPLRHLVDPDSGY
jgi:glyoxylate/hydroxypyruvate reductase A